MNKACDGQKNGGRKKGKEKERLRKEQKTDFEGIEYSLSIMGLNKNHFFLSVLETLN